MTKMWPVRLSTVIASASLSAGIDLVTFSVVRSKAMARPFRPSSVKPCPVAAENLGPVGSARDPFDLTYERAGLGVQHRELVSMGDVDAVGRRIEHHVVPMIRRAERGQPWSGCRRGRRQSRCSERETGAGEDEACEHDGRSVEMLWKAADEFTSRPARAAGVLASGPISTTIARPITPVARKRPKSRAALRVRLGQGVAEGGAEWSRQHIGGPEQDRLGRPLQKMQHRHHRDQAGETPPPPARTPRRPIRSRAPKS